MATWYRTTGFTSKAFDAVEVERSTAQSVWIHGKRLARLSSWESYFPTWEEARAHLLARAEKEIASLRLQLERANGRLGNIRGMKEPNP